MTVLKSESNISEKILSPLIKDEKNNKSNNLSNKDLSVNNQGGGNLADIIQDNFSLNDLSTYMLNALNPLVGLNNPYITSSAASMLPFGTSLLNAAATTSQPNDLQTLAALQLQLQTLQQQQQQQILQVASMIANSASASTSNVNTANSNPNVTTTIPSVIKPSSSSSSTTTATTPNLTTSDNPLTAIPGFENFNMQDFQNIYFQMLQYYYQLQLMKNKMPGMTPINNTAATTTSSALNNQLLGANYSSASLLQQQLLSTYAFQQQQQQQQQLLKSLDLSHYNSLMNLTPEQLALFGINPLAFPLVTSSATTGKEPVSSASSSSTTSSKSSENPSKELKSKSKLAPAINTTTTNEKIHILPNLHDHLKDGLLYSDDKIKNLMYDPLLQASNFLYPYSLPLIPIFPQRNHEMLLPSTIKKIQPSNDGPILKCPEPNCNKVFTRAYNLKSHQLSHSGVRPFKCKTCQTSFVRKHDLKRHERLHTGVKPYVCSVCQRGFYRSDALSRHEHSGTCSMNNLSNRSKNSSSVIRNHKNSTIGTTAASSSPYPTLKKTNLSSNTTTSSSSTPSTTVSSLSPSSSISSSSLTNIIPSTNLSNLNSSILNSSTTITTTKTLTPITTATLSATSSKTLTAPISTNTNINEIKINISNSKIIEPSKNISTNILPTTTDITETTSILDTLPNSIFLTNNTEIQSSKSPLITTTSTLLNSQLSSLVSTDPELSSKLTSFEDLLPHLNSNNSSSLLLPNLCDTNSLIPSSTSNLPLTISTTHPILSTTTTTTTANTTSTTSLITTTASTSINLSGISHSNLSELTPEFENQSSTTSSNEESSNLFPIISTEANKSNLNTTVESVLAMDQNLDVSLTSSLKSEK